MTTVQIAGLSPAYLPYLDGWALQRDIHAEVVDGRRPDTLVLCEHEPVYTAGKLTRAHERPGGRTPVVDVDRGGRITWHGPGQLTGYPIVRLPEPVDVVAHVRVLEELMIRVVAASGVTGYRIEGRSGVWVGAGPIAAKIGAIGVRVKSGVTMHGFALNCNNSLEPFSHIVPCGISDAGVTTITRETGIDISPSDVVETVVREFALLHEGVAA
ncbi:lipoyl(octanoyl) transferase LipB [Plantibacter sp. YIM 135249]|uniref:lipoyl(octanoyl) transferase LipB n=1 Tax=Plantibacter sp. YIM 135249 TaxID=3423918 RepID=UPI003D353B50